MLNTETDLLEASNQEIKEEVDKIMNRSAMGQQEKLNLIKSLEDECRMIEEEINNSTIDT